MKRRPAQAVKAKLPMAGFHDDGGLVFFTYVNVDKAPAAFFAGIVLVFDESRFMLIHGYAESVQWVGNPVAARLDVSFFAAPDAEESIAACILGQCPEGLALQAGEPPLTDVHAVDIAHHGFDIDTDFAVQSEGDEHDLFRVGKIEPYPGIATRESRFAVAVVGKFD